MKGNKITIGLALTLILSLVLATGVLADNFQNELTGLGSTTFAAPGSTTITYRLVANNAPQGDISGCNVDISKPATVTITLPSGVTADKTIFQFIACGNPGSVDVTFSSSVPGDYSITHSITGGKPGALYQNQADFMLYVTGNVADTDGDGVPDASDNCPNVANADQADADNDGYGDVCDANAFAPVVATEAADASGNEGDTLTTSGAFSDADGNGTLTITKQSGAGTVTDNGDGTWSWSLVTTDNGSGTVIVQANDGEHAIVTDSFDWTAANLAPNVATPSWESTTVACRAPATLTNISFSDAGVNDAPWTVDINWNDGPNTTFDVNTQGPQANQTHTYNTPGTYAATVTVTDKDNSSGSASTVTSLTVKQVYTIDFLPPFDDSSPSGLIVNKMKNGRVVPVKVVIYDVCSHSYITDGANVTIAVSKTSGTGTGDPVEEYSDAGQSSGNTNLFRWTSDASALGGGFWIYNLDSKALGLVVNNLYRVDVSVGGIKATVDTWAVLQPVK